MSGTEVHTYIYVEKCQYYLQIRSERCVLAPAKCIVQNAKRAHCKLTSVRMNSN